MKRNIVLKSNIVIPIFMGRLWLVVAKDAHAARREMNDIFGAHDKGSFHALHCCSGNEFGLFFHSGYITWGDLGHEIFHFVHCLMDCCNIRLVRDTSEVYAYVVGWAHDWVVRQCYKANVRILRTSYSEMIKNEKYYP